MIKITTNKITCLEDTSSSWKPSQLVALGIIRTSEARIKTKVKRSCSKKYKTFQDRKPGKYCMSLHLFEFLTLSSLGNIQSFESSTCLSVDICNLYVQCMHTRADSNCSLNSALISGTSLIQINRPAFVNQHPNAPPTEKIIVIITKQQQQQYIKYISAIEKIYNAIY